MENKKFKKLMCRGFELEKALYEQRLLVQSLDQEWEVLKNSEEKVADPISKKDLVVNLMACVGKMVKKVLWSRIFWREVATMLFFIVVAAVCRGWVQTLFVAVAACICVSVIVLFMLYLFIKMLDEFKKYKQVFSEKNKKLRILEEHRKDAHKTLNQLSSVLEKFYKKNDIDRKYRNLNAVVKECGEDRNVKRECEARVESLHQELMQCISTLDKSFQLDEYDWSVKVLMYCGL